jgi:hypothetical protein
MALFKQEKELFRVKSLKRVSLYYLNHPIQKMDLMGKKNI